MLGIKNYLRESEAYYKQRNHFEAGGLAQQKFLGIKPVCLRYLMSSNYTNQVFEQKGIYWIWVVLKSLSITTSTFRSHLIYFTKHIYDVHIYAYWRAVGIVRCSMELSTCRRSSLILHLYSAGALPWNMVIISVPRRYRHERMNRRNSDYFYN